MASTVATGAKASVVGKAKRKEPDDQPSQLSVAGVAGKLPKCAKNLANSPRSNRLAGDASPPTAHKASVAAAAAAADAAASAADTSAEQESEWRTEGSAYVGRGILRTVQGDDGQLGEGWGKIMGWLSAEESDFTDDNGQPAALWHVVFDDVTLGEEDLEEHEVKAAVIAWELATRQIARSGKKSKSGGNGKKGKSGGTGADPRALPAQSDMRVYFLEDADDGKALPHLAKELDVDPEEIVRLNSERYKGLKNSQACRLKAHTVLVLPPLSTPSCPGNIVKVLPKATGKPKQSEPRRLEEPATTAAPEEIVPATISVQEIKPSLLQEPPKPKVEAMDAKTALMLLEHDRAVATNSKDLSAESHDMTQGPKVCSRQECSGAISGEGRGGSDWLMAMRPNLVFPTFPGVTEDMGIISKEYITHFYCPFIKKQGITYAASGFEAVAPVTAEVEDNWAECDICQKWRRLPGSFVVADGAPFQCSDAGRTCQDAEDDWNDEDELEIENEKGAVLNSALQNLNVDGLEVLNLGRIELSKGYFSEKNIFPVGYTARRTYWDADSAADDSSEIDKSEKKIQYECVVEMGEDGPLFSVTPVGPDGQLLVEKRKEGETATKAWSSLMSARERVGPAGAAGSAEGTSNLDGAGEAGMTEEGGRESLESVPEMEVRTPIKEGVEGGVMRMDQMGSGEEGNGQKAVGEETGHWERDEKGNRVWVSHAGSASNGMEDVEMKETGEVEGGADGGDGGGAVGRKKSIINGNLLFGLGHEKVKELIHQLDGAEDIRQSQERWARRRQAGTLEERLRDMPSHLFLQQNKNARVPVRNVKSKQYLIGDEAPRAKDIKKFLLDHPDMVCVDPSAFNRADAVMLEDYCKGFKLCYDCKKGMFANKNPSKFDCRFKMLHSGPAWKKDPRMKEDKDPLTHLKHTSKFKTDYPAGTILKLDFNKAGEPTLLRMRKEFVQDALQVNLEWDDVLDDEGFAYKVARLEKRQAPRCERKLFVRPPWPPQLPDNPEGCARAAPRKVQSFSEKAEFTHHAKQFYDRIISQAEYKSLSDSERFRWMKENQNKRLILGRSGIEGYGIFARHPIFKGEMVVEYTGERVRPVVADKREEEYEEMGLGTYFWRLEDYLGAGEPPEGRASIVDATIRHNIGHYINHCCDPNCKASIMRINGQRKIIITAEYDIQYGEEITYDYKLPLESTDRKIPCYCGAHICKGTMN